MEPLYGDCTGPALSRELFFALRKPARLPPGLYWEEGKGSTEDGWSLKLLSSLRLINGGSLLRAFSCSELSLMLPGKIETSERVYYGIMIWGEGVYELKYESMSIKGYRPDPYKHLWKLAV